MTLGGLQPRSGLTYRPEIDGLRAIAVLAVVLYHAGLGCPGGYVGVDVFFVISGFLITSLILRDLHTGRFNLIEFWERRIRRIFPAMAVCIGATLIAGWFLLLPDDLEKLGASAFAQCLSISNIYFWRTTNYFGGENLERPLLHTWSLSVEEQFYLFLPVGLLLISAISLFQRRYSLVAILLLIALVSLLLSVWGVRNQPYATFFLLPTRMWELLCGAILAALPSIRMTRPVREFASWAGLAGITAAVFLYHESTPFPGIAALLPCLGCTLLIGANIPIGEKEHCQSSVATLLSLPPLRFIGLISYSFYLWHWPILSFSDYWKTHPLSHRTSFFLIIASAGIAAASWRWIEMPFRKRTLCKKRKEIFTFAIVATLAISVSSALMVHKHGIPSRLSEEARTLVSIAKQDRAKRMSFSKARNVDDVAKIQENGLPRIGVSNSLGRIDFVVMGDSHTQVSGPFFDRLAREHGLTGTIISYQGTPPLAGWNKRRRDASPNPEGLFNGAFSWITENRVSAVFLYARWSSYDDQSDALHRMIIETLEKFHSAGVVPYVMMDTPSYKFDVSKALLKGKFFNRNVGDIQPQSISDHQSKHPGLFAAKTEWGAQTFLDPLPNLWVSKSREFMIQNDGIPLYSDSNHLTDYGVEYVWEPVLKPVFARIASRVTSPIEPSIPEH